MLFQHKIYLGNIGNKRGYPPLANPNDNFELFMNRFTTLKQQCIPKKTVRYNKKVVLQTNFKTYRKIIRRSIMFAKRDYYRSVFNKYSANLKMTWQTINEPINRRKKKREYPQEFCSNMAY